MPAAISSAPSHAASALPVVLESAPADGGLAIAAGDNHAVSFTALFKQLAARQLPAAGSGLPLALRAEIPAAAGPTGIAGTTGVAGTTETLDNLAALLPFLEAITLTQAGQSAGAAAAVAATTIADTAADRDALHSPDGRTADDSEVSAEIAPAESGLVALAAPFTPPAGVPAPVTAPVLPALVAAVPAQPAIPAAGAATKVRTGMQDGSLLNAGRGPKDMLPADVPAGRPAPDQDPDAAVSRGREFSSQLVAAIEGSKELPRSPGSTAAAVQQVIAVASPHNAQATTAATPSLPVTQPVGAANWGEEVGNRIVWLVNRMENRAELVLTPPQMGRVEVSLTITGDQANASFVSANPAVREMLESALPRLREVLADAGIQLGQAQVSAENARQSAQQEKNSDNPGFDRGLKPDTGAFQTAGNVTQASPGLKMGRGLVDVFA